MCVSQRLLSCCSVWSRARFVGSTIPSVESNLFQPDGKASGGAIEFGRIAIQVSSNGSVTHFYDPNSVTVTDEDVVIRVKLTAPAALTVYAVHQTKIESSELDFSTTLIPMQPNKLRSHPVSGGQANTPLSSKPLDFHCTELDLSMCNGIALPFMCSITASVSPYINSDYASYCLQAPVPF
jgi:hypothetical protein